jgi:hypothetical protein
MYCPSCGAALAQQLKYCNRCGSQLVAQKDSDLIKVFEERMDSEMEGLFWITVLGIGLILGGMVLMKKVQLDQWMIVVYMILSGSAFITYFGLGVWQVRRLARSSTEGEVSRIERSETQELIAEQPFQGLEPAPSVTENTTRTLVTAVKDRAPTMKVNRL